MANFEITQPIASIFRLTFLPLLAASSPTAFAVVQCPSPDRSFKTFLHRFEEDIEFQRTRFVLPLVSRSGKCTMTDTKVELWDLERIQRLDYPLILSQQGKKTGKATESVVLSTKRYAEVFQDGPSESVHDHGTIAFVRAGTHADLFE